jgi:hypothetical protein
VEKPGRIVQLLHKENQPTKEREPRRNLSDRGKDLRSAGAVQLQELAQGDIKLQMGPMSGKFKGHLHRGCLPTQVRCRHPVEGWFSSGDEFSEGQERPEQVEGVSALLQDVDNVHGC